MQAVPRVIHAVASDITPAALAALEAATSPGTVLAIGPGAIELTRPVRRIHPLGNWTPRSAAAGLLGTSAGGDLALHAWSPRAARWCVAQAQAHSGVSIVIHVLSAAAAEDAVVWPVSGRLADTPTYLCYTRAAATRIAAAGVADGCIAYQLHGVQLPHVPPARDAARRAIGLSADDFGVLVLPPLERHNNTFVASWAVLLLEKLCPQARLILPSGGREYERLARVVRACHHTYMLRTSAPGQRLPDLLAAANVAVHLPGGGGDAWALTQAIGHGCPLVTTDTPELRDVASPTRVWTTRATPADVTRTLAAVHAAYDEATQRAGAAREDLLSRATADIELAR